MDERLFLQKNGNRIVEKKNQSTSAYSSQRIKDSIFSTTISRQDKTDGLGGRHKEEELKLPSMYLHQMVSDNSQVQLKNEHLHFTAHLEDSIHVQDLPEPAPGY